MRRCLWMAGALLLLAPAGARAASRPSFDDLVANLKSPNASTRQESASALGHSRRREAIGPLAALVRDPEPRVRLEVVRALRELRDVSAVPAVVTAMGDGDARVREEAIGSLVEIYAERDRSTPVDRFLEVFSDAYDRASMPPFTHVDPSVYQALAGALRDPVTSIRREGALALGILDARAAVPALQAALLDAEPDVRGAAATAVGKLGTQADGKALIPLLADQSDEVRDRALQGIGVLRVREAGPALRQLFEQNRRKDVGLRVLATLSRIADPAQADLFRELVQDADPEKKRLAVEGLGRIANPSLLPAFKKDYQRAKDDELRLAYGFALTLLGDRAFIDGIVLNLTSRTLGARCRNYILEMGPDVLPDLYPYLNDPDADIRAELCDLIAAFSDPASIAHLQPLVSDPSSKVSDRANRAIERLRRAPGAVPAG